MACTERSYLYRLLVMALLLHCTLLHQLKLSLRARMSNAFGAACRSSTRSGSLGCLYTRISIRVTAFSLLGQLTSACRIGIATSY
eukprot:5608184-Pleurochrysis_carterae.AAC.3